MNKRNQNRREFLKTGVAGLATVAFFRNAKGEIAVNSAGEDLFPELVEVTIGELQEQMASGKLTSRHLTEMYLERIKTIDKKTNSVIEINPDALDIASGLDRERKKGKVRSMMHGIPVLIKDNIDTADRMRTTAGSLALADAPTPKNDAFVVGQLRKAGVVIAGKTNLSEWANFRGNDSISGWSGRGGQTNNPYWLDQNPCGSSSGSGVSVSANLCAAAVGTETNGSIICPAVTSGVVGIKPTLGLVSRSGIIPIAHTQDTAGPMARTVTDAAILLGAMVGADKNDAVTASDTRRVRDFTKFLDTNGLKGARLGLLMQYTTRPDLKAYFDPFIQILRDLGAALLDVSFPKEIIDLDTEETDVLLYEFKSDLNKYLSARGGKNRTLEDLIKFNEANKAQELKLFGQELFIDAQKKGPLTDKAYIEAEAKLKRATRENGIDALLAKHDLDAFVTPTNGATWGIAAIAGYPYITVPAGIREYKTRDGKPAASATGMGFFGKAFSEPELLKFAYAFEQKTKRRVTPQFLPKYER